jgi:hypothetical protein
MPNFFGSSEPAKHQRISTVIEANLSGFLEEVKDDDFMKHDSGKPRPELIPRGFVMEMGRVMAHGAKKYSEDNWQKCDDVRRYHGAALRHILAVIDGEDMDPDSALTHLGHAACSLAMAYGITHGEN